MTKTRKPLKKTNLEQEYSRVMNDSKPFKDMEWQNIGDRFQIFSLNKYANSTSISDNTTLISR